MRMTKRRGTKTRRMKTRRRKMRGGDGTAERRREENRAKLALARKAREEEEEKNREKNIKMVNKKFNFLSLEQQKDKENSYRKHLEPYRLEWENIKRNADNADPRKLFYSTPGKTLNESSFTPQRIREAIKSKTPSLKSKTPSLKRKTVSIKKNSKKSLGPTIANLKEMHENAIVAANKP
jgi:hypothetical protein